MDVFIFIGLTEATVSRSVLPRHLVSWRVIDPNAVKFVNFGFRQTLRAFERFLCLLQKHRPSVVSSGSLIHPFRSPPRRQIGMFWPPQWNPKPCCASELRRRHPTVDYFPSFAASGSSGRFFDANLRSVR